MSRQSGASPLRYLATDTPKTAVITMYPSLVGQDVKFDWNSTQMPELEVEIQAKEQNVGNFQYFCMGNGPDGTLLIGRNDGSFPLLFGKTYEFKLVTLDGD